MLFEDSAVAPIHDHLTRLVGVGAAASLGDGLLLPTELGGSFRTSLLNDDPAPFRLMHSIDMASQHRGLSLRNRSARQHGADAGRSPSPQRWSSSGKKKPGPVWADPGLSMRVANPRQGDFAEPDQGFKGDGPGSPTCRIAATRPCNVAISLRFPLRCFFREWAVSSERCRRLVWRHLTAATAPPTGHRL